MVLLFVCGHAIRVVKGKPARVIGGGRSKLDQAPAFKTAAEQLHEVGVKPGER